jgi:cytochrome P450
MAGLMALAHERRAAPGDDLISRLMSLEVDGRTLDDGEVLAVLWNLVAGGLDTTGSLTSLTLRYLAGHPDHRARLADDPARLVAATEEFLRYFTVVETTTRTVIRDVTLSDQDLHRGDHVLVSWLSANRDPAEFAEPDRVILDRAPNRHLTFGVGPHRCIGMHVARVVFQVMVSEVLRRIPDFEVDQAATRLYPNNSVIGVATMPIRFTPGVPEGPAAGPF